MVRIGAYRFTPELNPLTRAYFSEAAKYEDAKTGAAMKAFAANPADKQAIDALTANPAMVGKIGTTCVATMINGGHALGTPCLSMQTPTSIAASFPATARLRSWRNCRKSPPNRRCNSRT